MGLGTKSVVIINAIRDHSKQIIRSLADRTGLFKSSIHCYLQAMDRRDWTAALGRGINAVTAFGRDDEGEIYIVDQDGEVYKVVPAS